VYGGMIVGLNSRGDDIVVNVCKDRKKTNMRSSTSEILVRLTPSVQLSLEQSLDFIQDDELVEVTPQSIRLRKRNLNHEQRVKRARRSA
jgi:GTP-binding protein